jgi:hypothetical protein
VAVASPAAVRLTCPRCLTLRAFVAIDGISSYRCAGCEWYWTFSTVAPTGSATAGLSAGGTAITVASGGASFTSGMTLLYDSGNTAAELLTVTATGSATSIPVTAAARAHLSGAAFGQLALAPSYNGIGVGDAAIPPPGWGF